MSRWLPFLDPKAKLPKSSPLTALAIDGDLDSMKKIIGHFIASYENSEPLVSKHDPRLQQFVDLTDKEGNTPLIGAAFKGDVEIIKFLVEKCGANYTLKNKIGCSPLWVASGYANMSCLEYLIDFVMTLETNSVTSTTIVGTNTKPHSKLNFLKQKNKNGDSPLLAAVSKGHKDVVKSLFRAIKKCFPEGDDNDDYAAFHREVWAILSDKNNAGDTLLSVCAGAGFEELLRELLQMEEECLSSSSLHLLDTKSQIQRPLNMCNSKGLSPILIACERNHLPLVKTLIEFNAQVVVDAKNRSLLAIASFCNCFDVAEYLLSVERFQFMLEQKDLNGCTPLWLAARTGNLRMVKLLLNKGADVSAVGAQGLSVFQVAEKFKKEAVVNYLKGLQIR